MAPASLKEIASVLEDMQPELAVQYGVAWLGVFGHGHLLGPCR